MVPSLSEIFYARVNFSRVMTGNLSRRHVKFEGDVESVYGPVASWGDVIDRGTPTADGAAGMGPDDVWLACQELVVDQAMEVEGPPQWEVLASQNVQVRAEQFSADGNDWRIASPRIECSWRGMEDVMRSYSNAIPQRQAACPALTTGFVLSQHAAVRSGRISPVSNLVGEGAPAPAELP